MLFELEAPRRQHNTFATAFIEELDSAVSTSGGIGATDEFGSGSIDADGIDADGIGSGGIGSGGIGSGGIGSGGIDDSDDVSKKPKRRSFDECQKIVFENEGGWSNHPNDRGGKTNFGISEPTFNSYKRRHPEAGLTDISKLTKKQAREIYKNDFWDSMKADELENGNVALLLYDMQVNHGGQNAALIAQRAINSLGGNVTVDSAWGSQTRGQLNALSEQNEQRLCEAILRERKRFYQDIIHKNPSQNVFSNGWNNRMEHLKDSLSY